MTIQLTLQQQLDLVEAMTKVTTPQQLEWLKANAERVMNPIGDTPVWLINMRAEYATCKDKNAQWELIEACIRRLHKENSALVPKMPSDATLARDKQRYLEGRK